MKKLTKKITSIAIVALCISIPSTIYGEASNINQEQAAPLYNPEEPTKNVIFDFIRSSQILSELAQKTNQNKEEIPFNNLSNQLGQKLASLAQAEKALARTWGEDEDIKKVQSLLNGTFVFEEERSLDSILKDIASLNTYKSAYTNTFDLLSLEAALKYNSNQLESVQKNLSKSQNQELLKKIFEYELTNFQKFIEQNKNALIRIEQIVNNDFIIEGETKICREYYGKTHCIKEKETHTIKTLSEINAYILEKEDISYNNHFKENKGNSKSTDGKYNESPGDRYLQDLDILEAFFDSITCDNNCNNLYEQMEETYNEVKPNLDKAYKEIKKAFKKATKKFKI